MIIVFILTICGKLIKVARKVCVQISPSEISAVAVRLLLVQVGVLRLLIGHFALFGSRVGLRLEEILSKGEVVLLGERRAQGRLALGWGREHVRVQMHTRVNHAVIKFSVRLFL